MLYIYTGFKLLSIVESYKIYLAEELGKKKRERRINKNHWGVGWVDTCCLWIASHSLSRCQRSAGPSSSKSDDLFHSLFLLSSFFLHRSSFLVLSISLGTYYLLTSLSRALLSTVIFSRLPTVAFFLSTYLTNHPHQLRLPRAWIFSDLIQQFAKMNDADVSKQIQQMVRFIRQEAEEKANEISVSAEEVRHPIFLSFLWFLLVSASRCPDFAPYFSWLLILLKIPTSRRCSMFGYLCLTDSRFRMCYISVSVHWPLNGRNWFFFLSCRNSILKSCSWSRQRRRRSGKSTRRRRSKLKFGRRCNYLDFFPL